MLAPPFLTSATSLSKRNGKQLAPPFKSAPAANDNPQSCTRNKKAEKMQDQSAWTTAVETVFPQFSLSNPNKVRKMKGIQTKQKSN